MQDPGLPFQLSDAQMPFLPPMTSSNSREQSKKITRHKFTPEEDEILKRLVTTYGPSDWGTIASHFGNRSARQCRDRWKHYISPDVVTGNWTEEENELLLKKHEEHGSQWSIIAKSFPGRTDIGVKNHFISLSSKKNKDTITKSHQRAVLLPNKSENGETFQQSMAEEITPEVVQQIQEQMQQLTPESFQQIQRQLQTQGDHIPIQMLQQLTQQSASFLSLNDPKEQTEEIQNNGLQQQLPISNENEQKPSDAQ